jgi:hypothetical protein
MNIRFSVSSTAVPAGGVESIAVHILVLPMVGDATQHGSPGEVDQPPKIRQSNQLVEV